MLKLQEIYIRFTHMKEQFTKALLCGKMWQWQWNFMRTMWENVEELLRKTVTKLCTVHWL